MVTCTSASLAAACDTLAQPVWEPAVQPAVQLAAFPRVLVLALRDCFDRSAERSMKQLATEQSCSGFFFFT